MEGTIGEIRAFAGNFAPRNWMFCAGQTIAIQSNAALFSILGTTYGGNGTSTFQLPNLASRVAIGAGAGPGLPTYTLGQPVGEENHTLVLQEMTAHTHFAQPVSNGAAWTGSYTLMGANDQGGQTSPVGCYLGTDQLSGAQIYAPSTATDLVDLNAASVSAILKAPSASATIQLAGGGTGHPNIQPVLGLNYIICCVGFFPSRD